MTDWAGGYVADIGYTSNFYGETAPSHLAFAALCASRSPGRAFRPGRVLELGFGQGFGLALLAAANPDVAFEGCDFNPEHVAHAQRLIQDAELSNVQISEMSFEESAAQGGDNNVDVIILHGIFGWVAREAQDAIVTIARQRLRPEGMLYVSYNCMPGWASLLPIRQFMLEVKRRNPGRSSQRQVELALEMMVKLKEGNAAYFTANPPASQQLASLLKQDRVYLAHEYLGEHWRVYQVSEMVERLAEAKLSFVCSASLAENVDQYSCPRPLLGLVSSVDDPIMRETLRDLASNNRFRRDVFARGTTSMTPTELRRTLAEVRFALAVPRKNLKFRFSIPIGGVNGFEEVYAPITNLLSDKIVNFDELLALAPFDNQVQSLLACLVLLVSSGQVLPVLGTGMTNREPTQRFNRCIVERARAGRFYNALASPVARTGVAVSQFALFALAARFEGQADDPAMAAKYVLSQLKNSGQRAIKDGRMLESDPEALEFLEARLGPVLEDEVPILQRLGVL